MNSNVVNGSVIVVDDVEWRILAVMHSPYDEFKRIAYVSNTETFDKLSVPFDIKCTSTQMYEQIEKTIIKHFGKGE